MLFPTVRFALFFIIVMPVSWMLMPVPRRGRGVHHDHAQPWLVPVGFFALALMFGPARTSVTETLFLPAPSEWPAAVTWLCWLLALGCAVLGVMRLADLKGLTRWNVFMLVASYVFYGAYDWHFVALLAGSTVVNQVLATAIDRTEEERQRKTLVLVAVAANLLVLGWFKYKGFFVESSAGVFDWFGIHIEPPARAIIPPVGISFFTFQALSYVIDAYRRKLRPVPLLEFGVYLSFFPHLVAGPIVRASEFLPQLRQPRDARQVDTGLAFWLITVGLFKKVVVSSYLASAIVDPVFAFPQQHGALDTLLGIYGYAIQIYCDFSGYTDMAIGLALLIGFRFPQNFDAPYTSSTLQEFWRRWHMTLSRWLRDYLYIPLGGNQHGPARAYLNLFLTMLIGGLWHGASWSFIVWGAWNGGYLVVERWWSQRPRTPRVRGTAPPPQELPRPPRPGADQDITQTWELEGDFAAGRTGATTIAPAPDREGDEEHVLDAAPFPERALSPAARLWLGRLLTFNVVCVGWVFFRSPTLTQAFDVFARLVHFGGGTPVNLMVVATIAIFLGTQFVPIAAVGRLQAIFSRMPFWLQGGLLGLALVVTSALSPPGVAPFIYFAF